MCKIIMLAITIAAGLRVVKAGFLGTPLDYSAEFETPLSYAGSQHNFGTTYAASHHNFGSTYSAPFSAPSFSAHPYAVGYDTPPVVKYHGDINPFTRHGSVPSIARFAHPAPVPSFYNSPLPYGQSALPYSGYSSPPHHTVVKYGAPITTTTTTYSTTAAVGNTYANPLHALAAW